MLFLVTVPIIVGAALLCGMGHSGLSAPKVARRMFVPLTLREFLLPPCPLCWVGRAAMIAVAVLGYQQFA